MLPLHQLWPYPLTKYLPILIIMRVCVFIGLEYKGGYIDSEIYLEPRPQFAEFTPNRLIKLLLKKNFLVFWINHYDESLMQGPVLLHERVGAGGNDDTVTPFHNGESLDPSFVCTDTICDFFTNFFYGESLQNEEELPPYESDDFLEMDRSRSICNDSVESLRI